MAAAGVTREVQPTPLATEATCRPTRRAIPKADSCSKATRAGCTTAAGGALEERSTSSVTGSIDAKRDRSADKQSSR
eukprot:6337898-Prymnesium_polylepis.1